MELNELISRTATVIDTAARVKEVLLSSGLQEVGDVSGKDETASVSVSSEKANQLLESLVSSKSDTKFSKIVAAATKIADATGAMKLAKNTVFDIASMSDEAVTRIKVAYQVANGEIDIEDAADKLIDRAAARLITVAEAFIDKKLPIAVDAMSREMVKAFPQTAPLIPIIKNTVAIIQPKLKELAQKGISAVAKHAKNVAPKVIDWAKNKVSSFAKSFALKFA